jgi:hypothetical protein
MVSDIGADSDRPQYSIDIASRERIFIGNGELFCERIELRDLSPVRSTRWIFEQ